MIAPETAGPASRFGNEMSATGWRITADEYDRKARELTERQTEIALRIEQHQKGSKRAPHPRAECREASHSEFQKTSLINPEPHSGTKDASAPG